MQPQTNVRFDNESFNRIKRTIKNMSQCSRQIRQNPCYSTELPEDIGLLLTNRCNLRCKHCFEWNNEGFHWDMKDSERNMELDLGIVEKVMTQTQKVKSNLFLWGGEPLYYNEWDRVASLIEKDPRWTVLCTNGILIEEKMDSILKISSNLAILTSIEGFENENDVIRGKGSFSKVMQGIDLILNFQRKGIFKGKQSVHCTINDGMIGKLYDFLEYFEQKGLDTVYLCFPWYIPAETSCEMDEYFNDNFSWLKNNLDNSRRSWHSYKFRINPDNTNLLIDEMEKINRRHWSIRVRYQPALELGEVCDYILGKELAAQGRKRCLAVSNRMDVLSSGKVSACKLFHEFCVGDLGKQDIREVWNGEPFNKIREVLGKGLMPVCSKCILLYLNGR